ncbi:hypothetical protein V2I01_11605 [Micromonospora sp. BRA006-A]|nr:hypothetical protein [Micromonospora sp. BRA006-A]
MTQPPAGGDTGAPGDPNPQPPPVGGAAGIRTRSRSAGVPSATPPRKRPAVLIVSLVLAAAVVLCGGGGTAAFLALRNSEDGQGAKEPQVAVDGFLKAVYQERDPEKAATFVCSAARDDEKIAAKVTEVRGTSRSTRTPGSAGPPRRSTTRPGTGPPSPRG